MGFFENVKNPQVMAINDEQNKTQPPTSSLSEAGSGRTAQCRRAAAPGVGPWGSPVELSDVEMAQLKYLTYLEYTWIFSIHNYYYLEFA